MEPLSNYNGHLVDFVTPGRDHPWLNHPQYRLPDRDIRQTWPRDCLSPLAPALEMSESSEMGSLHPASAAMDSLQSMPLISRPPPIQSHAMVRRQTDQPRTQSYCLPNQAPGYSRKRANSSTGGFSLLSTREAARRSWNGSAPSFDTNFSSGRIMRTASGSRALSSVVETEVKEYEPIDWINETGQALDSPHDMPLQPSVNDFPLGMTLSISQSPGLSSSPLSSSFTQSVPLTPLSAGLEAPPFCAPSMSRQESLVNGLSMFRIDSQMSNTSEYTPSRSRLSYPSSNAALPRLPDFAGCASAIAFESNFAASAPIPSPFDTCNDSVVRQSGHRQGVLPANSSQQSEIDTSQPTLAIAQRPLKPKLRDGDLPTTIQTGHEMIRIESENGVVEKCKITKTSYNRPPKEKIMCQYCDRKEGFRGEHELRRHQNLLHSGHRIGFICVDISPDRTMLSSCKNCRVGKVYGAYYNAAAHLRRVHFHPKKDGRKARGSVSRAGKGGGDDPPMEELKKWMKKITVTADGAKVSPTSTDMERSQSNEEPEKLESTDGHLGSDPSFQFLQDDFSTSLDISNIAASTATLVPDSTAYPPWVLGHGFGAIHDSISFPDPEIFDFEPFS